MQEKHNVYSENRAGKAGEIFLENMTFKLLVDINSTKCERTREKLCL